MISHEAEFLKLFNTVISDLQGKKGKIYAQIYNYE